MFSTISTTSNTTTSPTIINTTSTKYNRPVINRPLLTEDPTKNLFLFYSNIISYRFVIMKQIIYMFYVMYRQELLFILNHYQKINLYIFGNAAQHIFLYERKLQAGLLTMDHQIQKMLLALLLNNHYANENTISKLQMYINALNDLTIISNGQVMNIPNYFLQSNAELQTVMERHRQDHFTAHVKLLKTEADALVSALKDAVRYYNAQTPRKV